MILPQRYPGVIAERVQIQLFVFANTWTTSLSTGGSANAAPYFSFSDAAMNKKYTTNASHHSRVRHAVLAFQWINFVSPSIIFWMFSAQCRL